MIKIVLVLLCLNLSVLAKDIKPYRYVKASDAVSDFIKVGNTLIIGTEEGTVDIFDLKKDKMVDQITLPKYKNILLEDMRSLVFSVDYLNGKILFIGRVLDGYRELYLYENKKLSTLIDKTHRSTIQKIKFIDDDTALIQSMGNEIMLFNIKTKKVVYKKQLNFSSFSDFSLSEDKKYVYTADETPMITQLEVKNGTIINEFKKANKRDVFSVDYKNKILLTGGKDKRVVVYKSVEDFKMTKGQFFIYCVSLSPDASLGAFVKNEENDISIINTSDMSEKYLLKAHSQTIVKIDFYSKNELITADERDVLMFWKLD